VKSLYRAGSLTTVARGLAKFRLDLVGVQEVGWEKTDTVLADDWKNEGSGFRLDLVCVVKVRWEKRETLLSRGSEKLGWCGMWHVGGTGEFTQGFGGWGKRRKERNWKT